MKKHTNYCSQIDKLNKDYFFYQFENNSLYVFSSNENFNNAIRNTKAKDKTQSAAKGEPAFAYKLGTGGQKTRFVRKYFQQEDLQP